MEGSSEKQTVILIHGLGRTAASMLMLRRRLRAAGFATATIEYPSRRLRLAEAVEEVAREASRIADRAPGPVHIVGHSLGGLIALRLKQDRPELGIHRVVQLGSPNRGSGVARLLRDLRIAREIFGPVLEELAEDRDDPWMRDPDIAAFAGSNIPGIVARQYGDHGPGDGLVGTRSAWGRAAGWRDAFPTIHGMLPFSRDVAERTVEFLKTGKIDDDD